MSSLKGFFLVPTTKNPENGLWFIFYHESEGILAFDITQEHPDITYRYFENSILDFDDNIANHKTILRGGPLQDDSAMVVLHGKPKKSKNVHIINDDFSFLSYRFVRVKGKKPKITTSDYTPTKIELGDSSRSIIIIGFRLWEMNFLEKELKDWLWMLIPASPNVVFETLPQDRLYRARLCIN